MIVLMNYAIPLIILATCVLAWKMKSKSVLLAGIAIAIIYTVAQPTMLPKGTVAQPVIQQTEIVYKPIVDRSLKPMSDADRDKKREAAMKEINDSIESKITKGE